MLDALYVLVVADTVVVRDPLVVPYMTTGVVISAVVHSTIIWLHRGRHFVSCQAVMMHDAPKCYGGYCTTACRDIPLMLQKVACIQVVCDLRGNRRQGQMTM